MKAILSFFVGFMAFFPLCTSAQNYVDARTLTVINKAQEDDKPFQRLDVDKYPDLSETVTRYYRYSTGVAVVFRTDSRNLSARWTTVNGSARTNTPLLASRGMDMYIFSPNDGTGGEDNASDGISSGRWVWAGIASPSVEGTEHESRIVSNMDGTMHECLLYLPLFAEVTSLEIGYDEGAVMEAAPNPFKHKIVVVGSSLTHGDGVSRPSMAYPARMEKDMGYQFVNLGASGQCKLDEFYAHVVADTEADAFVFDAFSNPNVEQILQRLGTFVRLIREAHPKTPLIFLQTEIRETASFNLGDREHSLRKRTIDAQEMEKILAEYEDIYFINPAFPLGDDHNATVDGLHPTDLGYERVLNHLEPKLKEILDKYGIN